MKDKSNKYIYYIYLLNAHILINICNYLDNFGHIPHDSNMCLYVHKLQLLIEKIHSTESRGRVVTRWPGSQAVGGSIPCCATKFVRCKNLAFNIGECVSRGSDTT